MSLEPNPNKAVAGSSHAEQPHLKRRRDSSSGSCAQPAQKRTFLNITAGTPQSSINKGRYVVIHQVECSGTEPGHRNHEKHASFLDTPRLFAGDTKASALRGESVIRDLDDMLDRSNTADFVVYRLYDCEAYHEHINKDFEKIEMPRVNVHVKKEILPFLSVLGDDSDPASPFSEHMDLKSTALKEATNKVERQNPETLVGWASEDSLQWPYLGIFHGRNAIHEILEAESDIAADGRQSISTLLKFVEESCKKMYAEAEAMFPLSHVDQKHFHMLFGPNEVVILQEDGEPRGYLTTNFPTSRRSFISCWTWDFDGVFRKREVEKVLRWPDSDKNILPIASLPVFPLRYDTGRLLETLRERGRIFWGFRVRKYISYHGSLPGSELQSTPPRYMVDLPTLKLLHEDEENESKGPGDLSNEAIDCETPPPDPFPLLLPSRVEGFGFHDKKWRTLLVKHVKEVTWNKRAFERVVLDHRKKELIEALVKVHLSTTDHTDVIDNKGNGLIMLFHGGPGTGKTLTAESVAEFSERPLYRVTCGDIGTEPETVEKYLNSVLHVGTVWGCVVLLDEADVFLEERTPADLQRNALVSVFLRVLEYYQGIIIMTSNRVGIFDEAFKSRVQLPLHYPELEQKGRYKIWHSFIRTLQLELKDKNGERLEEVIHQLDVLARYELNGRQIRNTVKTATQLAQYQGRPLSYQHFESALEVANEFEDYLRKARGCTDEELARNDGRRF